jgi:periplasmic divalent cation tolerance protein
LFEEVEDAIRGLHSYDEPEILAVAIVGGSRTYLAWLESELKPPANVSGRQ